MTLYFSLSSLPLDSDGKMEDARQLPEFKPKRNVGACLPDAYPWEPVELFSLFFTTDILEHVCACTNELGTKRTHATGKSFVWSCDVSKDEMLGFLGLLIGMGLVQLPRMSDYWANLDCLATHSLRNL